MSRSFQALVFRAVIVVALSITTFTTQADAQSNSTLTDRQKHMIPIAAFTATGEIERLNSALEAGLEKGLTVNEIKEVLVQMYAYTGFPRSLNGLTAFAKVLEHRKASGIKDTLGRDATPLPSNMNSVETGNKTRNTLVKRDLTVNPSAYAQLAPVIDTFLKAHLFGDIFARDVLSYQDRELATISALAAMTGTEAQLNSHLKVSMNVGISHDQLVDFANALRSSVSEEAAQKAMVRIKALKP